MKALITILISLLLINCGTSAEADKLSSGSIIDIEEKLNIGLDVRFGCGERSMSILDTLNLHYSDDPEVCYARQLEVQIESHGNKQGDTECFFATGDTTGIARVYVSYGTYQGHEANGIPDGTEYVYVRYQNKKQLGVLCQK